MQIVIAGAGSVGRSIARELLTHGHQVTLIDISPSQMEVASVAEADWVLADACSPDALAKAGIEQADVLVCATGNDKVNLVVSLLSKSEFGVPKTVARINNPKNEWMFDETWGIDVAVSTPRIMTSLVEEAVSEGIPVHIFHFHSSRTDMFSVTVPEGSALVGQRISALGLPMSIVLAAVLRDNRPMVPLPDLTIEAKDGLLLLLGTDSVRDLEQITEIFALEAEEITDLAQED